MIHKIAAFVALFFGCAIAQAAIVYIDPATQSTSIGNTVSVALKGQDFTQPIEGGGVNLSYNPLVLQLNSVKVDNTTWDFFTTPGTINNTTGKLTDLTFSSFAGRSGSFSIAQITFQSTGLGTSLLTLTESTLNPFASGGELISPPVSFAAANIFVSSVPEPGEWFMLITGIPLVGWQIRRKHGKSAPATD
jgi:hypothetical protein